MVWVSLWVVEVCVFYDMWDLSGLSVTAVHCTTQSTRNILGSLYNCTPLVMVIVSSIQRDNHQPNSEWRMCACGKIDDNAGNTWCDDVCTFNTPIIQIYVLKYYRMYLVPVSKITQICKFNEVDAGVYFTEGKATLLGFWDRSTIYSTRKLFKNCTVLYVSSTTVS